MFSACVHCWILIFFRSLSGKDGSTCAQMCNCSSSIFNPVCGNDGITYFSACRAGCKIKLTDDDVKNEVFFYK